MKNERNMALPKDNPPVTEFNDMKFCDLVDKEFKIALLRKLNKLQENTER